MTPATPPTLSRHLLGPAVLAGYGVALVGLQPGVVNGDGIGYLKQISGTDISPGHLIFLPLLRGIARLWPHQTAMDLVFPLRLLAAVSAALALLLLYDAIRRLHGRRAALFGVALLGLCHAFLRAATELEVYGIATLSAVAVLWALVRHRLARRPLPWAAAAGLFAGVATLLHLTLVLLGFPLLLLARRRGGRWHPAHAAVAAGGMLATVAVPLALILARRAPGSVDAAWAWLRSADHGIPDPHGWTSPVMALWGLGRSLVHVPYPYEAPMAAVVTLSAVAAGVWLVLVAWARRSDAALDWPLLLSWSAPLALFAVVFFPSDTERWVFVLPAVVLSLAPLARSTAARWLVLLLCAVAAVNVLLAQLPAAMDRRPLLHARQVERLLRPGDLIVSPGHGWDELVGLGSRTPPARFPLIYHAGAEGGIKPAVQLMHRRIGETLVRRRRVYVARIDDEEDPRGFKELAWLGLARDGYAGLFRCYRVEPTSVDGLVRIGSPADPAARHDHQPR